MLGSHTVANHGDKRLLRAEALPGGWHSYAQTTQLLLGIFSAIAGTRFAVVLADEVQVFNWDSVLLSLLPYVKFSFCSYESLASSMDCTCASSWPSRVDKSC